MTADLLESLRSWREVLVGQSEDGAASNHLTTRADHSIGGIDDDAGAARAADHGVAAAAVADVDEVNAGSVVGAGPHQRRPACIDDRVGARAAVEDVVTATAEENVVAGAAVQDDRPRPA